MINNFSKAKCALTACENSTRISSPFISVKDAMSNFAKAVATKKRRAQKIKATLSKRKLDNK